MTAFTVDVSDSLAKKLDQLADKLDRSRAYVAAQAIEDFVAREASQLGEIEAAWPKPIEVNSSAQKKCRR